MGQKEIIQGDYAYLFEGLINSGKHYANAYSIFQEANAKDDMLETLLKLSLVHRHSGDHEAARDYARQAAKIFREINCGYLKPLYSYVAALTEVHDHPESLAPMLEAIDVSRTFGTREWTWQIQFELARLYKKAGDISNSVKYCREAINTLKEITESFDDSEQISSYLEVPLRKQVFDFVKSLKS
jgi:tetratricopeptide (TPR) repeat protein